jgi:hypothetical protein
VNKRPLSTRGRKGEKVERARAREGEGEGGRKRGGKYTSEDCVISESYAALYSIDLKARPLKDDPDVSIGVA